MNEKKFYLYLKESPAGLKYLGKTIRDPFTYRGSGIYWTRHLDKHNFKNSDIKTTILLETFDEEELKAAGLYYSQKFNVVESKEFANIIDEIGQGGKTIFYEKDREIISKRSKQMWENKEFKEHTSNMMKKSWTDERKEEYSRRMKENNPSKLEHVKEKLRQNATGRKYSDEVNKKKGKPGEENVSKRPDVRKKISERLKGHPTSEETKEKIRNSLRLTRERKKLG